MKRFALAIVLLVCAVPALAQSLQSLNQHLVAWPLVSARAALNVARKYGLPDNIGTTEIVWHSAGPWKSITVHRIGSPMKFPLLHRQILTQTIDWSVPQKKVDALQKFYPAIDVHQKAGTVSVTSQIEGANFAALNLAHEIVIGQLTVSEARNRFQQIMGNVVSGNIPPIALHLQFQHGSG